MIEGEIKILGSEYRPCFVGERNFVGERKALFHRWVDKDLVYVKLNLLCSDEDKERIISAARKNLEVNPGCDITKARETFGIVEYEDGRIEEVNPKRIRFVDNLISEYAFREEGGA